MMIKKLLLCSLSMWIGIVFSQTCPITVNTYLNFPYSAFLSDYVAPGSNKLRVHLSNTDAIHSRDVYLKISIKSDRVSIETRPEFKPLIPITLPPIKSLIVLSGEDLYEYFDYRNIVCSGISKDELIKNGRLPEGFYTFCIQVWDYEKNFSYNIECKEICKSINIQLSEPPTLLFPANGTVIKATEAQSINFQWQIQNSDVTDTKYKLLLYELSDQKTDPKTAVANGQARQIFEAVDLDFTSFNYDVSHPLLEKGKIYAFQVTASSSRGSESFRNKGVSQIGWFYYGYPEKGNVAVVSPANEKSFTLSDNKYFEWKAADNLTSNQTVRYNIKIVKSESKTEDALMAEPFFEFNTDERVTKNGSSFLLTQDLDKQERYIWQVKAFSEDQEIAKSEVKVFYGPPVLEEFYAGNHKVKVIKTLNKDKSNLSGVGLVSLSSEEKYYEVKFDHLNIIDVAGIGVLQSGEIVQKLDYFPPIVLDPSYTENGEAYFKIDSLKLDYNGLYVNGSFEWNLPFATNTNEKAKIRSKSVWIPYNTFTLTGRTNLTKGNNFDLLDPLGFRIELLDSSIVTIKNNKFSLELTGQIILPAKVRGSTGKINLPFRNVEHLFYIVNNYTSDNLICPINRTGIFLRPLSFIIDLSESKSPNLLDSKPDWKGAYFPDFKSGINIKFDGSNQIKLSEVIYNDFSDKKENTIFYADNEGVTVHFSKEYNAGSNSWFNGFVSSLKKVKIEIDNNSISDSYFKGCIKIPFISETKDFNYTVPVNNDGLQKGWLDESLDGHSFDFNPKGGEQKLNITINRAVFEGNMLDMNISILWPSLSLELKNVQGFRIWSDNKIGFGNPNTSIILSDQENGKYKAYPLIANSIGAGMKSGIYAFGLNATIGMSSDVAGANGPPVTNIYSAASNSLLNKLESQNLKGESFGNLAQDELKSKKDVESKNVSDINRAAPDGSSKLKESDDKSDNLNAVSEGSQSNAESEKSKLATLNRAAPDGTSQSIKSENDGGNLKNLASESNQSKQKSENFLSGVTDNPSSFNEGEVIEGAKQNISIDEAGLNLKTKKLLNDFKIKPPSDVDMEDTATFKGTYNNNITGGSVQEVKPDKPFKANTKKIELPAASKKEIKSPVLAVPSSPRFQISEKQRNEIYRRSNIEVLKIIGPITKKVDSTINKIRKEVEEQQTSINSGIKEFIGTQIDTLEERFIRLTNNDFIDISKEVHRVGDSLTVGVSSVLTSRVDSTANLIYSVLNINVTEAVSKELNKEITLLSESIIENGFQSDYKLDVEKLKNRIVNNIIDSGLVASLPAKAEKLVASFDLTTLSNELWARAQQELSEVLAAIAKEKLHELIDSYTKTIDETIDSYTVKFTTKINEYRDEVKETVDLTITDVSNTIYESASGNVGDPDLKALIRETCDSLQIKLTRTFDNSTDELANTLNTKIIKAFGDTVKIAINLRLYSIADELLDNGTRAQINVPQLFTDACNQVGKTFTMAYICNTISEAGNKYIKSLDPAPLINEVVEEATQKFSELVKKKATEEVVEVVTEFVTENLGGDENPLLIDVPLDLENLDEKLAKGDLAGIVKLDDITVSLSTSFLKFTGKLAYDDDDKIFGNVWKAKISATVNIVNEFSINVNYVTGYKDKNAYWFCQVRPGTSNDDNIAEKRPQELSTPIYLGPVKLVGAGGYIMHHIKVIDEKTIAPDKTVEYGSYMNFVFFDASNDGKTLRIEVSGESTTADGNTKSKYVGNMQIVNANPSITKGDESAAIKGDVLITYDRKEKHFVGLGTVVIDNGILCASGAIGVETSPGKWAISIGTRDHRIYVQPGCAGWTPTGWFVLNQNSANLGIGVQYDVRGRVGFDVGVVALYFNAYAGFAYGAQITIQYFPYFALNDVGIWADAYAKVDVDWRIDLWLYHASGTFQLCDVYAKADLKMIFNPPPTRVTGELSGHVRLAGVVSTDFSAGFTTNL